MIAGDMSLRNPPKYGGALNIDYAHGPIQPVQWTCTRTTYVYETWPENSDGKHGVGMPTLGSNYTASGAGAGFPQVTCDGDHSPLRADVHFPSCYNPAVDPADYTGGNMDYQTNGTCPKGWVQVPRIFYEVYHSTDLFKGQWKEGQGEQPFVLSTGDPTGYGIHGDFVNGWDTDVINQIALECTAGDYGMDKCEGLIGGLTTDGPSCILDPNAMFHSNEVYSGIMKSLPGGFSVGIWGQSATTTNMASVTKTAASSTTKADPAPQTKMASVTKTAASSTTNADPTPQTNSAGKASSLFY
jgi:hypothetical protein